MSGVCRASHTGGSGERTLSNDSESLRSHTLLPTPSPGKLVHESHWPTKKGWEYFVHHGSLWLQSAVDPAAAPRNYHLPQCHFSTGQIPRLSSQALPVTSLSVAFPAPALCHRHRGCHQLPCSAGLCPFPKASLLGNLGMCHQLRAKEG